ncbi:MAG: GNAT family N-acetyltransferase [Candidatus Poribacteria bacterium]
MAEVTTDPYAAEHSAEWDDFVLRSRNGTLFHRQSFLRYHPPDRFNDCSLMLRRRGRLVGVFPAAIERRNYRDVLRSHPGASYGGLVIGLAPRAETVVACTRALVAFARGEGFDGIEMRLPPSVFHRFPAEDVDLALHASGFRVAGIELTNAICLDGGPDAWQALFQGDTANRLRRIDREGAVSVEEGPAWPEYWPMLEETLSQFEATPTHSLEEIERLARELPDDIRLFRCRVGGVLVGGVVVFVGNPHAVHTFYMAQNHTGREHRCLDAALSRVMEWAHARGHRFVNLGTSTLTGGPHLNAGLCRFKERFGGFGVARRTYALDLRP